MLFAAPPPSPAAVLEVNDLDDPGTVGDGGLTLREALRLAAGSIEGLSPAELGQVSGGTPGAGSPDVIRFALAGTITLAGDGTAEALPPLSEGDEIDGEGQVVISGIALDRATILWGLRITTSGCTVRGLAFEDMPGTVLHVQPPPGGTVAGTRIVGNRVTRPGVDAIRITAATLPVAGASVSGGRVEDTVISDNLVESGTPGNLVSGFPAGAMNIMAAYGAAGGSLSGARVVDTVIARNTIRDVFQGVFARAAVGAAAMTDNAIEGLRVEDNLFERVNDQTLYVGAATVQAGGASEGNAVRTLIITRNVLRGRLLDPAAPYLGGGPFVSGGFLDGCAADAGTSSSVGDVTESVEISDNTITDRAPYGIYVQGAQSCGGGGGTLTGSMVRNVLITRNTIEDCDTGISFSGGSSFLTKGPVANEHNAIEDAAVVDNVIAGNALVGVELIGGVSNGGEASRNHIARVDIADNTLAANHVAVAATAGVTIGAGDVARSNVLRDVTLRANQIADSVVTGVLVQGSTVVGNADTEGNEVLAFEIADNALDRNGGVGLQILGASVRDGMTAGGNVIGSPRILRNVIRDTSVAPDDGAQGFGIRLLAPSGTTIQSAVIEGNAIERVASVGIALVGTRGHVVRRNTVSGFGKKALTGKRGNKVVKNRFRRRAR